MPNRNNGAGIREYFDEVPYVTLRSECGIPNVPSLESMRKFLPEEKLWPINESWALHDWKEYMRYESLNSLSEVNIRAIFSAPSTVAGGIGRGNSLYTAILSNGSNVPAVQTRIQTINSATGKDVLPVFYSDNYLSRMPGESRTVTIEFDPKYLEGSRPFFELSGWNTRRRTIIVSSR